MEKLVQELQHHSFQPGKLLVSPLSVETIENDMRNNSVDIYDYKKKTDPLEMLLRRDNDTWPSIHSHKDR